MPRRERKQSGTGIYHVMLRGINQQGCLDMDERKVISDESVRKEILKHKDHGVGSPDHLSR